MVERLDQFQTPQSLSLYNTPLRGMRNILLLLSSPAIFDMCFVLLLEICYIDNVLHF